MYQNQSEKPGDGTVRPTNGHLNNPLDPETLRSLEQLAAWDNAKHTGEPPELGHAPLPKRPIAYEEPPGEDATDQERMNWGLRALAAYDQMTYPQQSASAEEDSSQSSEGSSESSGE